MKQNLLSDTLFKYISDDFESAWNGVTSVCQKNPSAGHGNFMFARQAMTLLEFAARLGSTDTSAYASGNALFDLSQELYKIEPKYFTQLPGACANVTGFDLPYTNLKGKGDELLWAIFDIIRHGLAHQYLQIPVGLTDGVDWQISLNGVTGLNLDGISKMPRPKEHLAYKRDGNDLWLIVRPEMLFLDFKNAIADSGLLNKVVTKKLEFDYLIRPKPKNQNAVNRGQLRGPFYQFNSLSLEQKLASAGHTPSQPKQSTGTVAPFFYGDSTAYVSTGELAPSYKPP